MTILSESSREIPAQSEARKKWAAFARKKSSQSLGALAKAGFLHPQQCNAAAVQGSFEGLSESGCANGLLFMLCLLYTSPSPRDS